MALAPLEGFAVGVTADRRWQDQAELLARRGARVVHGPSIATSYLAFDESLRDATAAVIAHPPDVLVATTGIGIRAWLEAAQAWGTAEELLAALAAARVVARGPKAAAAVQAAGLGVWQRSPNEQLDELVGLLLGEELAGCRVAVQEAGAETPQVRAALEAAGARVVEVPVYRWRLPDDEGPAQALIDAACDRRLAAVTFTSAPAVQNLFRLAAGRGEAGGQRLRRAFNDGVVATCVGPVCAAAARAEGVEVPLAPPVGRLGLMVRALTDTLAGRRRVFVLGDSTVVVQGSAVHVDGRTVELPPLEQGVLAVLAQRPGAVVPRSTLLHRVWGSPTADPHLLEATITRLRRRLGPTGAGIRPSPGRGYRLDTATPGDGRQRSR